MKKHHGKLKIWELSLLVAVCIAMCAGVWAQGRQTELSGSLIRLHVIANSDSAEDQELKLAVRDSVVELLTPILTEAGDMEMAGEIINGSLGEIEAAARRTAAAFGAECAVTAELGLENYPTREYDGFSLPAGEYVSLRVTLGEGDGQNWWCVVFPPLCLSTAQLEAADDAGLLSEDDIALITESDSGYVLRFRVLELWDMFIGLFR